MPTIPCQNILNPNDHVEPDWLLPSQPERHEHWLAAVQGRCPHAAPLARRLLSELTRQDGVHITLTPGVASQLGPELIDVEVQMQDLL